jgi:type II secretory pathway pseudopilin PulG
MTLVEVLIALAISGLAMASIVGGYLFASGSAEKSALSLAANASALRRIEETRCARWIISTFPATDEVVATNFPDTVVKLDFSGSGTGITYATNHTIISQISTNPYLKRVRVDCIWPYKAGTVFTNSIETCRAPDQ